MIASSWPTTEETSLSWLRRHGIDPDTATERDANRSTGRDWDRARMASWGAADAGWGTFDDEFVGVNWFLWRRGTAEDVMAAARALVGDLTKMHGAPTEVLDPTEHGGTWFWRLPEHLIDMYAYHGLPRPDGLPSGEACVQLHVDLRTRSEAREAHARTHHCTRPVPFALPEEPRPEPDQRADRHTQ